MTFFHHRQRETKTMVNVFTCSALDHFFFIHFSFNLIYVIFHGQWATSRRKMFYALEIGYIKTLCESSTHPLTATLDWLTVGWEIYGLSSQSRRPSDRIFFKKQQQGRKIPSSGWRRKSVYFYFQAMRAKTLWGLVGVALFPRSLHNTIEEWEES